MFGTFPPNQWAHLAEEHQPDYAAIGRENIEMEENAKNMQLLMDAEIDLRVKAEQRANRVRPAGRAAGSTANQRQQVNASWRATWLASAGCCRRPVVCTRWVLLAAVCRRVVPALLLYLHSQLPSLLPLLMHCHPSCPTPHQAEAEVETAQRVAQEAQVSGSGCKEC